MYEVIVDLPIIWTYFLILQSRQVL